ncbi:outer membrane beta-barrel protein [Cognatiyoonia sp. IB215446]|uniref:outer membrane protein n=1 Tax=Cognatiyoonia sp. IB215446 TaxID=3097355 RepID=UPI002A16BBF6|nr:outer membrane beta-barrel protein [Cognatiyoonia sp. IB215446]MDX8349755.1 outer membrane beta-barrel protein [Cognatiyoonia sp. IB215446]
MTYRFKTVLLALATTLPTHALADWNGAYAGLILGANTNTEFSSEVGGSSSSVEADDSTSVGIFGGINVQNDDFVFGGELAFSQASDVEAEILGETVSDDLDILDLKGRAGFAVDNILFYGVAGFSRISDGEEDSTGFNFGVGADFDLGNNAVIGAEYLARRTTFDDEDPEVDLDLDTFSVRAALKF